MKFAPIIAVASILALGACSAQQIAQVNSMATQIQTGCAEASPLIPFAGPLAPYILGACTADGMIKLASDPSSPQWLGQIIGQVKTLAGIKS